MPLSKRTLEKLKKNPHYKISQKNLMEVKEDTIETFGKLPIHDTNVPKHPFAPTRIPYENKS